jgi:hypothetical protein
MSPLPARGLAIAAGVAAALALAPAAHAAWRAQQTLDHNRTFGAGIAIATTRSGRAVAVWQTKIGLRVAVARPGRAFAHSRLIERSAVFSSNVAVAIAPSGRAIVAQSYDDGSFAGPPESRGEDSCCSGTKVAIVSAGGRVTSARAVRPRGTRSPLAAVAASTNRFGVLVGAPGEGGVRFIAVSSSGRAGPPRLVAATHYRGVTLQFAGGRAIVALTDEIPARIAVSTERSGGSFTAPKVAVRTQGDLQSAFLGRVEVTADGRGRNVVAYDSGTARGSQVKVVRFDAAGRATTLAGPAPTAAQPAIATPATDGGAVAVAYTQSFLSHVPLLVTRTAAGRLRRRTLPSLGGQIQTPAVATGGGAIALTATPSTAHGPLSTRVLYLRSPTARVDRIVLPSTTFGSPPVVIDGRGRARVMWRDDNGRVRTRLRTL